MTITEPDFAALMSASVNEPTPAHYVCNYCWPGLLTPAAAFCGATIRHGIAPPGVHLCAKCIAIDARPILPCGHP